MNTGIGGIISRPYIKTKEKEVVLPLPFINGLEIAKPLLGFLRKIYRKSIIYDFNKVFWAPVK